MVLRLQVQPFYILLWPFNIRCFRWYARHSCFYFGFRSGFQSKSKPTLYKSNPMSKSIKFITDGALFKHSKCFHGFKCWFAWPGKIVFFKLNKCYLRFTANIWEPYWYRGHRRLLLFVPSRSTETATFKVWGSLWLLKCSPVVLPWLICGSHPWARQDF